MTPQQRIVVDADGNPVKVDADGNIVTSQTSPRTRQQQATSTLDEKPSAASRVIAPFVDAGRGLVSIALAGMNPSAAPSRVMMQSMGAHALENFVDRGRTAVQRMGQAGDALRQGEIQSGVLTALEGVRNAAASTPLTEGIFGDTGDAALRGDMPSAIGHGVLGAVSMAAPELLSESPASTLGKLGMKARGAVSRGVQGAGKGMWKMAADTGNTAAAEEILSQNRGTLTRNNETAVAANKDARAKAPLKSGTLAEKKAEWQGRVDAPDVMTRAVNKRMSKGLFGAREMLPSAFGWLTHSPGVGGAVAALTEATRPLPMSFGAQKLYNLGGRTLPASALPEALRLALLARMSQDGGQ